MSLSDRKERLLAERRLIIEMIEASMQKALEKGPHPLVPGANCNCIACVNKRKRILNDSQKPWRYRL